MTGLISAGSPHLILTSVVHNELVHATGTQRGAHSLGNHLTGIDVADKLRDTLGGVCPLLQKDYRCGLWRGEKNNLAIETARYKKIKCSA